MLHVFNCLQMPVDAEPYDGVFVADTLGTACIQRERNALWITHPGWRRFDEDCLNMDVYTPEVCVEIDVIPMIIARLLHIYLMNLRTKMEAI